MGHFQVVDERMWGEEDKPEPDQKPGEEQQGKDAPQQVSTSASTFPTLAWHPNLSFKLFPSCHPNGSFNIGSRPSRML